VLRIVCYLMKYIKYFSPPNNIKNDDDDVTDNDNSFYVWG